MKAIIILSVLLITISMSSEARTKEKAKADSHKLEMAPQSPQKLCNHIFYPEEASDINLEGSVSVAFFVDSLGNINIKAMNGHPVLMKSVREQLQKMCVDPTKCQGEKMVCFKFEIR